MNKRYVFDTNSLISAALFRQSVPRQALDLALQSGILLVSSDTIIELTKVLLRTKFDQYVSQEQRELFLTELLQQVEIVLIDERIAACRDPKDDIFLEVAVNSQAAVIVTGDDDLLVLHPYRDITICTPRAFLELVEDWEAEPPSE
jgi:putative PIN family toxin of toxin-antitoxin system